MQHANAGKNQERKYNAIYMQKNCAESIENCNKIIYAWMLYIDKFDILIALPNLTNKTHLY